NPAEAPSIPGLEIDSKTPVVVWNDAISQEAFVRMSHGKEQPPRVDAAEWGDISQSVSSLARIRPQPAKVVIVAKGWEPPLLSFRDLVAAVRAAIGVEAIIVVVPLGEGGEIDPADRQIWSQALARHADPLLYVAGDRQ
ncbi:MAG: DUF2868 domain-containing protein, partial [Pseudomonadales bacterium]|nr:DUF2868 domain-containing protein [Pseudomonadales bacterium]